MTRPGTIREHQLVRLRDPVGTVVGVWGHGEAFEVEFPGAGVITAPAQSLVPVSADELALWDPPPAALHVDRMDLAIDRVAG